MEHRKSNTVSRSDRGWGIVVMSAIWAACCLYSCRSSSVPDEPPPRPTRAAVAESPSAVPSAARSAASGAVPSLAVSAEAPFPEVAGVEPRFECWKDWLAQARRVAKESKHPRAQKVADFLAERTAVVWPRFTSHDRFRLEVGWVPVENRGDPSQKTLVLLPQDAPVLGVGDNRSWFEDGIGSGAGASFSADSRLMILRPQPISPLMKGVVLLHEGDHALTLLERPYDWNDKLRLCEAERETHEFQNALTVALGGLEYAKALAKEKERLAKEFSFSEETRNWKFPGIPDVVPEFDRAFGPSASNLESSLRRTSLWIHAMFLLLEDRYPGRGSEMKARFYCVQRQDTATKK